MLEVRKQPSVKEELNTKRINFFIDARFFSVKGSWQFDLQTNDLFCSDVMVALTTEQSQGTRCLLHPDDVEKVRQALQTIEQQSTVNLTFRIITSFGEVKTVKGKGNFFIEKQEGFSVELQQKYAEQYLETIKLRHEVEQQAIALNVYNFAGQIAAKGIWYINTTTHEAYYSDTVYRIFNLPPQSLNAHLHTFTPFIHPDEKDAVADAIEAAFKKKIPIHLDFRVVLSDLSTKIISYTTRWMHNEKGEPIITGVIQDFTHVQSLENELKGFKDELHISTRLLQQEEQLTKTASWQINLLTRQFYHSGNLYRIYGIKPPSILNLKLLLNYVHPEDRAAVQEANELMFATPATTEIEFRIIRADGKTRYLKEKRTVAANADNEQIMLGTLQDVSDQKIRDKKIYALDQSISGLKTAVSEIEHITSIGFWQWNLHTGESTWSNGMYSMLGYKSNAPLSQKVLFQFIHSDDRKLFSEQINAIVKDGGDSQFIFRLLTKGETRLIQAKFKLEADEEVKTFLGILQDVTEAEINKANVQQQMQIAEMVGEAFPDIMIITDNNHSIIKWNKKAEEVFAIKKDKAIQRNIFDVIPSFRRQEMLNNFQKAIAGEKVFLQEQRDVVGKGIYNLAHIPIQNDNGQVSAVLSVFSDITRQFEIKQQLTERLRFIEKLLEASVDRVIVLDRNMNYLYWNKKAEEYYGLKKESIVGKNILEVFPGFINDPSYDDLRKALQGETVHVPAGKNLTVKKGYFETYLVPIKDDKGAITAILWISHDLLKEYQLRRQQQKHLEVLDAINENYFELDGDYRITYMNQKSEEFFRKNIEEMVGRVFWEVFPQVVGAPIYHAIKKAMEEGASTRGEFISPVGGTWVFASIAPTADGVIVIFFDIQKQKEAEVEIMHKQQLLQATMDSSMDMIQVFEAVRDEEGEIIDFKWILNNHTSEKIYGDVIGESLVTLNPGVVEKGIFETFKKVVESGMPDVSERHYTNEQFNGWFLQSVVKLNDGVATTTVNITGLKEAEQKIKANEEFLQSVIDSSLDVIQVFDPVKDNTGKIIDFTWRIQNNKGFIQNGNVIGESLLQQNPGVIPTGIYDRMVQVVETGEPQVLEQYYSSEQFNDQWYYLTLVKQDDSIIVSTKNITEKKKAEAEILRLKDEVAQKATNKYKALFDSIDEGFAIQEVVTDENGNVTDVIYREVNGAFEHHTGMKDVLGKKVSEVLPHLEQSWLDALTQVYKTGKPLRGENYTAGLDRWFTYHYSRIGGAGSTLISVVFNDITDRKRTETQLKENYEQIVLATKAAKAGWGYRNFVTGKGHWDEEGKKIIGFPNEEDSHAIEGWQKRVHPEDLPIVEALMADCIKEDKPFDLEYRVIRADGETRFIHAMGTFTKDEEGTLLKGGGLVIDVTERKQQEQQQEFLLQFSDTLRTEPNADAIAKRALQLLTEQLALDRCYIGVYHLSDDRADLTHQVGNDRVPPMPEWIRLSDFPEALKITFDRTLVVDDVFNRRGLTETDKQNMAAFGFGALVAASLRKGEHNPQWVMVAVSATPRQWTDSEIRLIEEVTERTWAAVERAKAEEALRKSEEKYRWLFETMDIGFALCEPIYNESGKMIDFRYLELNPAFKQLTGIDNIEAVGKRILEIVPGLDPEWFKTYQKVVDTKEPIRFEEFVSPLNRWYDVSAFYYGKDLFAVYYEDITQRKLAQQSKFFLASIVESSEDSIVTVDFNNVITSWNKGAEKLYGYPANEAIGKSLTMVTLPEDLSQILKNIDKIKHSKVVERFEAVRVRKQGELIDLEIELSPVKNDAGEVIGVSTFARNITERKRREANLELLAKINLDFAPLLSVHEVMEQVGERLAKHLQLSRCQFSIVDEENDRIEVVYEYLANENLPGLKGVHQISEFLTEEGRKHYSAGKLTVINAAAHNPLVKTPTQMLKQLGLGSFVDVPHLESGRWKFLLTIGRAEAGRWRRDEVELVQEIVSKIYIRIQRARAEEALRFSENRFRMLAEGLPLIISQAKPDGSIEYINQWWTEFSGHSAEQFIDGEWLTAIHPEDREMILQKWQHAVASGEPYQYEFRALAKDNHYRWLLARGIPVKDENGQVIKWMNTAIDIDDRKRAEEQMKTFNESLEALVKERTGALQHNAEELQKNLAILQHTEELAQMGSWEYVIPTGEFNWSEGMYHLFDLQQQIKVQPEIYLRFATTEDRPVAKRIITYLQKKHQPFEEVMRIRTDNGERLLRIRGSVVSDEKGKPQKVVGVDMDITNIKKAEEQVKESRYWLKKTAEASPDSITVYEYISKKPVYLNNSLAEWVGVTNDELISMGIEGRLQLLHPDDRLRLLHFNEKIAAAADGDILTLEYRIKNKEGQMFWVRNRSKVFQRNATGNITHILSILENITEEKRREEALQLLNKELEKKNKELERKNEEITSFAFVASHDLKEPLRKLHTFADMIQQRENLSEPGHKNLTKIFSSIHRLDHLIEDILAISKVAAKNERQDAVDLNKVLQRVKEDMDDAIEKANAVIDADELPQITGDENQLYYLFKNIISNSLKFQAKNKRPVITISAAHQKSITNKQDNYLKLSFADNGIGFPQEYAHKVFQMFQRLHSRDEYEGTGIGLAICKKIMEKHGGYITAESEKGKGTVIHCYFPSA